MALESIEGVIAAHSLHIWSLTVNKAALAVHLAIGACMLCVLIASGVCWQGMRVDWGSLHVRVVV